MHITLSLNTPSHLSCASSSVVLGRYLSMLFMTMFTTPTIISSFGVLLTPDGSSFPLAAIINAGGNLIWGTCAELLNPGRVSLSPFGNRTVLSLEKVYNCPCSAVNDKEETAIFNNYSSYHDQTYDCTSIVFLPKLFLEIVTGFSFVSDEVIALATVSVLFRSWTAGGGFSTVCTFDTSN